MTENSYIYSRPDMPVTAGGRHMRKITGEHEAIQTRGTEIENLGELMTNSANRLGLFADGTVGRGDSFEAIRDQAKEVHDDLRVAGERYTPSGAALTAYGVALGKAQSATDWLVEQAHDKWGAVNRASSALSEVSGAQWQFDFDKNHDVDQEGKERPDSSSEQATFDTAVEDFEYYWSRYDAPTETWEGAYDIAEGALSDVNANGVEDGFWDNMMPAIEALGTILFYVGLALIVVAFVFTGPLAIIAAVAATVVAVLSVAVEASKFLAGRGDMTALILSAVAVIPFGRLAKFASFAKVGKLGELLGSGGRFSGAAKFFGSEFGDFAKGWKSFNTFLGNKIPGLFTIHGLNSQNLMRMLNAPGYIIKNTHLVPGGWAGGWRALAGNPTNLLEAFGGMADVMKNVYYNAYSAKGMFG
ncbi:hypothetical protein [Microbacterium sp. NPDC057650]|uniref:hypothetical protein n=1 Tax=unclassified Microbacterium TaxID=2609290 RepID=UPI00366E9003